MRVVNKKTLNLDDASFRVDMGLDCLAEEKKDRPLLLAEGERKSK